MITRLFKWWTSLPIGYSELHAPLSLTKDDFRVWLRENFADRLPSDLRERNIRVQLLVQDHCIYKRAVNHMDQQPNVTKFKCRGY